ncbi:MAG: DNA cytosine methyltransferase [Acholeplasma sp.]|nr:DNA cytosine methyltransferase [Acholeplasma sp.]
MKTKIKVVDLFSGVGGLTFGFYYKQVKSKFQVRDEFDICFANDFDSQASEGFKSNFKNIKMLNCPIETIDESLLLKNNINYSDIDLIIGGPPCQSFSTIGKRKNDSRSRMYEEYVRILTLLKPKVFIFENVLGILSFKTDEGIQIIDLITSKFEQSGYQVNLQTINAKHFQIPQNRIRVFLVGIRIDSGLIFEQLHPQSNDLLTLRDAISDLPLNTAEYGDVNYLRKPSNRFQRLMRNKSETVSEHNYRPHGQRLQSIMRNLGPGESLKDINKKVENGDLPMELLLTSGYPNSYGRLLWNKPSSTITNNFGTPSSIRCIHPSEDRSLTIREAARLQTFPDWFLFHGSTKAKKTQIGNAVPPLLSLALANSIIKMFLQKSFTK